MNLPDLSPPALLSFPKKPKVLMVADVPYWSFDYKLRSYRKYLPEYDIDIGYANVKVKDNDIYRPYFWRYMAHDQYYDVILHLHPYFVSNFSELQQFSSDSRRRGTKLLVVLNYCYSVDELKALEPRLRCYDAVGAVNQEIQENCRGIGMETTLIMDGVDMTVFFPEIPLHERPFRLIFVASRLRLEHKGYSILQEVKEALVDYPDIEFDEVIADSFNNSRGHDQMAQAYNNASIFLCLSKSEGGPNTLLESIASGCVAITTPVGYTRFFKNILTIDRDAASCVEKIMYLYNNREAMYALAQGLRREIVRWDNQYLARHWGKFIESVVVKKKGKTLL